MTNSHNKIATGGGQPKADDWRNLMRVLPVALAVAWDLFSDNSPTEAPRARTKAVKTAEKRTKKLLRTRKVKNICLDEDADGNDIMDVDDDEPSKNYMDHYNNCLRFSAGIRILCMHSVTPLEAQRGQHFLSEAFQSWAAMSCHLTPNFHASMHVLEWILAYGPAYAWWVFAYERFIGELGKYNTNCHKGGELEGTLMRGWWKIIMTQELVSRMAYYTYICSVLTQVSHLQSRENRTDEDDLAISALLDAMKGGAEKDRQRGTLLNYLSSLTSQADKGILWCI